MKAQEIIDSLKNHKGQHKGVCWRRIVRTYKGAPTVEKETRAYVRAGINFANLTTVKQGIEDGTRGPVEPIWNGKGQWVVFPFILKHVTTEQEYVRLYPASFDNLPCKVSWYVNGAPTTYEAIEAHLRADERKQAEPVRPECFTVKAEDVRWID